MLVHCTPPFSSFTVAGDQPQSENIKWKFQRNAAHCELCDEILCHPTWGVTQLFASHFHAV